MKEGSYALSAARVRKDVMYGRARAVLGDPLSNQREVLSTENNARASVSLRRPSQPCAYRSDDNRSEYV